MFAWRARGRESERGISLVEMVVAIFIAGLLVAAVGASSISALKGSLFARQNQIATDLANARIEQLREVTWSSLGAEDGATSTTTVDGIEFALSTEVATPTDSAGAYYRTVSVTVSWVNQGSTRTKRIDTAIAQATRGLALPDFEVDPVGETTATVNPGAIQVFGFEISNQGAPDSFNVASSGGLSCEFLRDNGDGVFEAATDTTALTDTTGDAVVDVGRIDPLQSVIVWAVYTVDAGTPDQVFALTVTVTSAGQPTAATAARALPLTVTVDGGTVGPSPSPSSGATCADPSPVADPATATGYTRYAWTLHNSGSTAWPSLPLPATGEIPGSEAMRPMVMNLSGPAIPTGRDLPAYSTDLQTTNPTRGRILTTGGSFTATGAGPIADFLSSSASKTYASGIVVRAYVKRAPGDTSASVSLTAQPYAYRSSGNKTTELLSPVTASVSPWACDGWQEVSFSFPISAPVTLSSNYVLAMRIWNSGAGPVVLAYDHADYPSTVTVVER